MDAQSSSTSHNPKPALSTHHWLWKEPSEASGMTWMSPATTGSWPCQASRKSVSRKGIFQLPSILLLPSTRCLELLVFDLWFLPRIPEEYEMHEDFSEYKKETALISYSNINGLALKASDNFQLTKPKFSPRSQNFWCRDAEMCTFRKPFLTREWPREK